MVGDRSSDDRATLVTSASNEPHGATSSAAEGRSDRLSVRGVSKRYGGIHALEDVSFSIMPGEIHALVGENGAGKSTLVKVITGLVQPDAGHVLLNGIAVNFDSPMAARMAGITAMYQDMKLFPQLDVAENIFAEIYPVGRWGLIDRNTMYREASRLLGILGVDLDPKTRVSHLSVADMQYVGIARAISSEVQLLILDEPTASITPIEADRLFSVVRRLRDQGASILFISHRIEELHSFVDTVTVLRDGRHVATVPEASVDQSAIVRMMVNRSLQSLYAKNANNRQVGDERLRLDNLTLEGVFDSISFAVHSGEVVTMAGLVGAGRTEIALAIFGITPPTSGHVFVNGREVRASSCGAMLDAGLAYVPEDRDGKGLITQQSIQQNIVLAILDRLTRFGLVQESQERRTAQQQADELEIKMAGLDQFVAALSGGNRQKVVLAKWLAAGPSILILDEPTHGIDVGTKAQVHRIIEQLAAQGLAILQISSDLPEVLATSDRILVIREGRLVAEFNRDEATEEKVMLAATGATQRQSSAAEQRP
jgi:rhamnose transport system ATP-binding protein